MRGSDRIGFVESDRRVELLRDYRNDVVDYFNHVDRGYLGHPVSEDSAAQDARRRINMCTDEVCDVIHAAGISTTMTYTPPPMIGGYVQNIELVHNIFNLSHFDIQPHGLVDMVERAIGVYERGRRSAVIRTFNPFFYLALLLDAIARSPFLLATRLGLPGRRLEDSLLGVAVRSLVYLAGAVASLIAILGFLGYLDEARKLVTQRFGI